MYKRILEIKLPKGQSSFLWGARKTGKSTFLRQNFPKSIYYDFLRSDDYLRYSKAPYKFREELLAIKDFNIEHPVIIDEVQKIPHILDEVHWLIENRGISFILCGSSARKLKRVDVNLLGGRAWKYNFFPLVYPEVSDFSLLKVLNNGCIPSHYKSANIRKTFKAYIEDYLVHEIQAEGLVRNLSGFARFLDILPFSNGEMINFTNISREVSIDAKTVKEYFYLLEDTMLGYLVYPYAKKNKREIISSQPKFYLFDVGLATNLARRSFDAIEGSYAGNALENYLFQELVAYNRMNDIDLNINYWRTKSGLEVDFIIDGRIAVEVKISSSIHPTHLKGLKAINEELPIEKSIIVCMEPKERLINFKNFSIRVVPVEQFLSELWGNQII